MEIGPGSIDCKSIGQLNTRLEAEGALVGIEQRLKACAISGLVCANCRSIPQCDDAAEESSEAKCSSARTSATSVGGELVLGRAS